MELIYEMLFLNYFSKELIRGVFGKSISVSSSQLH